MNRMDTRPSIIERAFELAKSGKCGKVEDIRVQLNRENYAGVDLYIRGGALLTQLRYLLASARPAEARAEQA